METESGAPYYTLTFTITFPHANDVVPPKHRKPSTNIDTKHQTPNLNSKPEPRILNSETRIPQPETRNVSTPVFFFLFAALEPRVE